MKLDHGVNSRSMLTQIRGSRADEKTSLLGSSNKDIKDNYSSKSGKKKKKEKSPLKSPSLVRTMLACYGVEFFILQVSA